MNAALMLMCAATVTQGQTKETVFEAPKIQVKQQRTFSNQRDRVQFTLLYNGINIGTNFLKPTNREDYGNPEHDWSRVATTYFHRQGPMGIVMEKYNWFPGKPNTYSADARLPVSLIAMTGLDPCGQLGQALQLWSEPPVAVVDIDTGTMASYARVGQTFHFFEAVPTIGKLSIPDKGERPLFHFVPDALDRGANIKIFHGEPRASVEKHAGAGFYQAVVVNTYKLPVVTVHKDLMTKEGLQVLMEKTREDGILCYHISSRYYKLAPIIAAAAGELKYARLEGRDMDARDHERGHFSSSWVMVARKPQYLAHLKKAPRQDEKFWSTPDPVNKKYLWTDKGENSFRGVYYADPTIGEFGRSVYQAEDFLRRRGVFPNQINRWMQPVYGMIQSWATARADALNRDTPKPKEPTKR